MSAHDAASPNALFYEVIRGQFKQRISTPVVPAEVVSPLKGKVGASGKARLSFENAGSKLCIDATINGFNPKLAYLSRALTGANGPVVVNFSSKRKAAGRFLGCIDLANLVGADADLAAKILDKPEMYYFTFHQDKKGSGVFNNSVRGQLI